MGGWGRKMTEERDKEQRGQGWGGWCMSLHRLKVLKDYGKKQQEDRARFKVYKNEQGVPRRHGGGNDIIARV